MSPEGEHRELIYLPPLFSCHCTRSFRPTPTYQYHTFALTPSAISGDRSLRVGLRSLFRLFSFVHAFGLFMSLLIVSIQLCMFVRGGATHSSLAVTRHTLVSAVWDTSDSTSVHNRNLTLELGIRQLEYW